MTISRTRLGPLELDSAVVLAPMAGYTDSPMRRLARRFGAGLVFSEMLSGEAIRRRNLKTFELARFTPEERPIFLQYVAVSPEMAAEVAKLLEELEPDGLDLNFGCPVRKIVQHSGGAALLKDVPLLGRIVEATVKATHLPVSLKIRCGWDEQSLNAVQVAHAAAESGAKWITVHARTRSEFRTGKAHWEWIAQVKEKAVIPVIGNGDVREAEDAVALRKQTGCDVVMIGRAAIGYPFIFRETNALLSGQTRLPPATPQQRWQAARQQLEWMIEFYGEERAVRHFRKHAIQYLRGLPHSASIKDEVVRLPSARSVLDTLERYFLSLPDRPAPRDPAIFERASIEWN
ncbi:MAG: tRNA dihydrouridine synthase DusB [bacterium]